ncbi:hypothetical protein [Aliamphritea ceti]|uniref:hypothetical protein n=1 Tax=Aliamphritea ceti TaxID=1524258 RepID=UPI0021C35DB6|nr:hypothetical protein [Aliamphritea ceti]
MNINTAQISYTENAKLLSSLNKTALPANSAANETVAAKPSVQLTLSREALKLSEQSGSGSNQYSDKELLNDIFNGVKEQLSAASEAGTAGAKEITDAGKEFNRIATEIEKEANGQPLNDKQIERLAKADDAFHSVVDKVYGNPPQGSSAQGAAMSGGSGGGSGGGGGGADAISGSSTGSSKKKSAYNPMDINKDGKVSAQERMKALMKQSAETYNQVANNFSATQSLTQAS